MENKQESWIQHEEQVVAHNYAPLHVVLSKGKGAKVWDMDGKEYLDFMSAYSAVNAGHGNRRLLSVFMEQASRLVITSRAFYNDQLEPFATALCDVTGLDMVLPMNTGAEAVETAIKAARKWGYQKKGIEADKAEIIVSSGNFHGRTTTIVSFSDDLEAKAEYGPYTPGFKTVPFGDAQALRDAITPNTVAFLTEPMQGEGGIILPPKGWLKEVRDICTENNVLLVVDEIQTGMGRTGKNFAFEHEIADEKPDMLLLAKALGGGLFPLSACVGKKDVMEVFTPGTHGSTWGGNPLACAIGKEAIAILVEDQLADRSEKLGAYLVQQLEAINTSLITEIRGAGLWVGVDIDTSKVEAKAVAKALLEKGILCKETHAKTLRLAPPLIITKAEIDWAIEQIKGVLASFDAQV
ncbi:MAG: ornithine--oxo-acid transaminase [Alphaproteobacteria bacterium]|nr:ornithine--oxo-acid transaminase [Alphaproteobacteria bacterium]